MCFPVFRKPTTRWESLTKGQRTTNAATTGYAIDATAVGRIIFERKNKKPKKTIPVIFKEKILASVYGGL